MRRVSPVLLAACAAVFASASVLVAAFAGPAAAVDTGTPPGYVQQIGGPGAADMYPSGMEVAPDGTIVVADTGNNRISKYNPDGSLVWQVGSYGMAVRQFNNPRDVGIDSAGNIYVADTANTRIVKLTPDGVWVTSWKGPSNDVIKSPIGISVHNNVVYVADGGALAVRVFDTNGNQLNKFTSNGVCTMAALRDVDADSAGNIYVANYTRNDILKLSSTGTCITKWGAKGAGDGQFANPYGIRIAHDPVLNTDLAYVADSNNERIQVFTLDGGYIGQFGIAGTHDQLGTFTQLRRVAVDANGDVWGADLWGWRVERFQRSSTGWTAVQRIGQNAPQLTDTAAFHEPRQIAFDASGDLHIADTVNQRVDQFTESGSVVGSCGLRGSSDGEFNWPRGTTVDTANGQLWIADTKQSRLQVMNSDCSSPQILGKKGATLGTFNWPMAIAIRQSDRTLWIADTNNNRVEVWNLDTRQPITSFGSIGSGTGQFNQPRGITVAPDGTIWVADRTNNRVVQLTATSGAASITWTRSINQGFSKPEGVAVDSSGRIYVADTINDRLVALASDGTVLGTTAGPTGMNDPAAVAVGPDGRIYVSDTINDRVLVFDWNSQPPPPDTTLPDSTISTPAVNAHVTIPVAFTGGATDDRGVSTVEVAVQDRSSKLWWNPATGSFVSGTKWSFASVTTPGQASVSWSISIPITGGSGLYTALARATDTSHNVETVRPSVRFAAS